MGSPVEARSFAAPLRRALLCTALACLPRARAATQHAITLTDLANLVKFSELVGAPGANARELAARHLEQSWQLYYSQIGRPFGAPRKDDAAQPPRSAHSFLRQKVTPLAAFYAASALLLSLNTLVYRALSKLYHKSHFVKLSLDSQLNSIPL